MRIFKVEVWLHTSEDIDSIDKEAKLVDDLAWTLTNHSDYVTDVLSIDIDKKSCDSSTS